MEYDLAFQIEIIHCLCRLHNLCVRDKLPILQGNRVVPSHVDLDEEGRLIDNRWREGLEAAFNGSNVRGSNVLRDHIVEECRRNEYRVVRSHNT